MSNQSTVIFSLLLISMAMAQNIGTPVVKTSGAVKLEYGGMCPRPAVETNSMVLNCGYEGA